MLGLNYWVKDVTGGLLGAALLAPVFTVPGYALAHGLNVRGFRERGPAARAALAVVLSVALAPALTFFVARLTSSPRAAAAVYAVGVAALAALKGRRAERRGTAGLARAAADPMVRLGAAAALVWGVFALLQLSDIQVGGRLYGSPLFFDYAKNVSVTDAIVRTGVPPANPSFYPGAPIALYYYYYWFLLCGVAASVGGTWVDARAAVMGGTVWAGLALIATVALYACDVWPAPRRERRRTVRIALALLLVSGLDVVYVVAKELRAAQLGHWYVLATAEWWNEQVTAWTNAVLWVPHHTAGLIAGLAALLLLREAAARERRGERWALGAACGTALASMLGLSIWVAVSFAASWGAWVLVAWWRGWRGEARLAVGAGVVGCALSLPFIRDLARANLAPGRAPVRLTVRQFYPLDVWLDAHAVSAPVRAAARLAALPLNYLAEFGFFAVAAGVFWWWRHRRTNGLSRDEASLLTLAASGLAVSTFLRAALRFNDLGWRGLMTTQFVTLLWAAYVWVHLLRPARVAAVDADITSASRATRPTLARWTRAALLGSLAVGVATVTYDAVMLRLYPALRDLGVGVWPDTAPIPRGDGVRLYAYRAAYEQAGRVLPANAVLQPNPVVPHEPLHQFGVDTYTGVYALRQVAVAHREYGTLYGVAPELYDRVAAPIDSVFGNPGPVTGASGSPASRAYPASPDWPTVAALCRRLGITAWVVTADDPVWQRSGSWVWQRPAIVANNLVRVIRC